MERIPNRRRGPDWDAYYKKTEGYGPRPGLVSALELTPEREAVVDLGAGALNDARFLLEQGFARVVAVDSAPSVKERALQIGDARLEIRIGDMQDVPLEPNSYNLVSAQFSLFFVPTTDLSALVARIHNALKSGGVFSAQFLGPNDDWDGTHGKYTQNSSFVRDLLDDFDLISLEERESDSGTAEEPDSHKHWHTISVLARKSTE